jgi:RNA polymerase sigma-70 factor (ECF subfamily)
VKEKCDYCLTAFCHCLSNEARLIVLFCDIVELPCDEVGLIMEKSEETIRQYVSRSRKKIRKFMEQDCILFNSAGSCRCRIRQHVLSVNLDKEYKKLAKAAELVEIFKKFDRELPRKNYWEKIISTDVTN